MSERPLTAKERLFVEHYIGQSAGNGTDACRRAGYEGSDKTLATQASRLLNRPQVQEALKQRRAIVFAETERMLAEVGAEEARAKAEGILSAIDCAVILSGIATGQVQEEQPEGGTAQAKIKDKVAAIKVLATLRGYEAPTKTEVSGAVALDVAFTPEIEVALDLWLLAMRDERVQVVLAELRGEA
jgi:phage terminase small subunit